MLSPFIILMLVGAFGLTLMAIPGLSRHGHSAHITGHGPLHLGHGAGRIGHAGGRLQHHAGTAAKGASDARSGPASATGLLRLIPSPRVIFSLMALYGGFGLALADGARLSTVLAAWLAIIPAALFEKFVISRIWNALMTFEGVPSSPMEKLTFLTAEAVTPFRNGKGMVTVERDGRAVQLRASLPEDQMAIPVRVGDKLRIETVDPEHERVTVSLNV